MFGHLCVLSILLPCIGRSGARSWCGCIEILWNYVRAASLPLPLPRSKDQRCCVGGINCSVHGPLHLLYIDNVRSTARYIWMVEICAVQGPLHTPRLPPLIGPAIRPAVWLFRLVPEALGQVYVLRLSVLCLSQVWYVELAMYSCHLWGCVPFFEPYFSLLAKACGAWVTRPCLPLILGAVSPHSSG